MPIRSRFCKAGHDKWLVGESDTGQCDECKRLWREERAKNPLPPERRRPLVHGPSASVTEQVLDILTAAETAPPWEREEAKRRAEQLLRQSRGTDHKEDEEDR